jgi:hypothetical protein
MAKATACVLTPWFFGNIKKSGIFSLFLVAFIRTFAFSNHCFELIAGLPVAPKRPQPNEPNLLSLTTVAVEPGCTMLNLGCFRKCTAYPGCHDRLAA